MLFRSEAKEALDQKAIAQNELMELKSELEARRKLETQYDKQITNALGKDYNPRPDSKERALMSRGEKNDELQNYKKLFFENVSGKYPMKMHDKGGNTLSASSSFNGPEESLKAETKVIQLGCIDPNKSLYMANSTNTVRTFGKSPEEGSIVMNSSKAVDTLDFLDRIAGVPRRENNEIPSIPNGVTKERSSNEDKLKMPKYPIPEPINTIRTGRSSLDGSGFNSLKLQELNMLNNQRLEELSALGKTNGTNQGDELDKLDNLLMDIIEDEKKVKNNPKNNIYPRRNQALDSIGEADFEDSLKASGRKPSIGTLNDPQLSAANLQLPTLRDPSLNI